MLIFTDNGSMGKLYTLLTKSASYYDTLADQYEDRWEDEDAMEEMAGKAHGEAHRAGRDVTPGELRKLVELLRKKDEQVTNTVNVLDGIKNAVGAGAGVGMGALLGGVLGGAVGHYGNLDQDSKEKAALIGLALGGLGGGVGGYSLAKGMTPSVHKTSVDDDAEEMAAYINKYREDGHPGML